MNYENLKNRTNWAMDGTAVLALVAVAAPGASWVAALAIPVWIFCLVRFIALAILAPSTWGMLKSSKMEAFLLLVPFLRVFRLLRLFRFVKAPVRMVKGFRSARRLAL